MLRTYSTPTSPRGATAVSVETISVATQTPPTVRESVLFRSVAIQCGEPCGELECDKLECDDSNTQTPVLNVPSQSESCTSHAQERDQNNSDQLRVDSDPHVGQERAAASDLSNISSDPLPSEPNESAKTDGNSRQETITQPKRTLLIGSSIIKDVSPRGLKDTDVRSHSGARINNIRHHIANMDLTPYKRIVFQVGGNDYSSRRSLSEIQEDFCALIQETREKMNCEAEIFVSGLPPRSDVHVQPVNILLRDICTVRNITFIAQSRYFIDEYGGVDSSLYKKDHLHLNKRGTVRLLVNMDRFVSFLKTNKLENGYCKHCGEANHTTTACRYDKPLQCLSCKRDGHKQKFCSLY